MKHIRTFFASVWKRLSVESPSIEGSPSACARCKWTGLSGEGVEGLCCPQCYRSELVFSKLRIEQGGVG